MPRRIRSAVAARPFPHAVPDPPAAALLVGITGSARRPRSGLLVLPDGRRLVTGPFTARQARAVAELVAGRLRRASLGGQALVHWLTVPHPVPDLDGLIPGSRR
ncbi:hypothetical protein GCM10020229_58210 [Kitasatospora albolonga]|uniref:hypothetical protein n=1 Tax=Kitasatospora albolonga TaxID=68173 RepID=UPI0031E795F6